MDEIRNSSVDHGVVGVSLVAGSQEIVMPIHIRGALVLIICLLAASALLDLFIIQLAAFGWS